MEEKKIQILQELIHAFDKKNFDFEAWKIKAKLILSKIFGENDIKILLIEKLHYDYSSWALRDHSGGKQHDSIKDQAKEIIETGIIELKLIEDESDILAAAKNHLTGYEFDNLQNLLNNNTTNTEIILEYFSKIASSKKDLILTQIILKLK